MHIQHLEPVGKHCIWIKALYMHVSGLLPVAMIVITCLFEFRLLKDVCPVVGGLLPLCSFVCSWKLEEWSRELVLSVGQVVPRHWPDTSLGWSTQVIWAGKAEQMPLSYTCCHTQRRLLLTCRCLKVSSFGSLSLFTTENKVGCGIWISEQILEDLFDTRWGRKGQN